MTELRLKGKVMIEGRATGKALVSNKAFTFAHGVDPYSGIVTDVRSDIRNANVKGTILIYPFGKGSTTGTSWFLETVRNGNEPLAVVTQASEPIIVVGSVLARILYEKTIPVMSEFSDKVTEIIRTDDEVSLDSDQGELVVRRKK